MDLNAFSRKGDNGQTLFCGQSQSRNKILLSEICVFCCCLQVGADIHVFLLCCLVWTAARMLLVSLHSLHLYLFHIQFPCITYYIPIQYWISHFWLANIGTTWTKKVFHLQIPTYVWKIIISNMMTSLYFALLLVLINSVRLFVQFWWFENSFVKWTNSEILEPFLGNFQFSLICT